MGKTQYGWVVDPVGFRYTLRKVYERYHLPILVTENGIGAPDILEADGKIHDQDSVYSGAFTADAFIDHRWSTDIG